MSSKDLNAVVEPGWPPAIAQAYDAGEQVWLDENAEGRLVWRASGDEARRLERERAALRTPNPAPPRPSPAPASTRTIPSRERRLDPLQPKNRGAYSTCPRCGRPLTDDVVRDGRRQASRVICMEDEACGWTEWELITESAVAS